MFLQHFPQYRDTGIPWRSLKTREKRLQSWFCLPSCIPVYPLKTLKGRSAIFLFPYQINIQFIKVFRVFSDTADIHTLKPKHGWRLPRKVLQGWDADLQALQIFVLYAKHIYKSNVSHIYSWRNIWTCKIIQGDSSSHVSCFLSPQRSRKLGCVRKHSDMRESYFVTSGWCMYVNKMGNVVFR